MIHKEREQRETERHKGAREKETMIRGESRIERVRMRYRKGDKVKAKEGERRRERRSERRRELRKKEREERRRDRETRRTNCRDG